MKLFQIIGNDKGSVFPPHTIIAIINHWNMWNSEVLASEDTGTSIEVCGSALQIGVPVAI